MKGLEFLKEELSIWNDDGTYQVLPSLESLQQSTVVLKGKEIIQLSSNNYLVLTTRPQLKKVAAEAVQKYGAGTGSVRTIAGTFDMHQQFENRLAQFKNTEAVLSFQSSFTANVGVLTSLFTDEDVVISDELNHASIIDGIRLTKAARRIYKHCDIDDLKRHLEETQDFRIRFVVTDGMFSMDGDIAILPDIVEL